MVTHYIEMYVLFYHIHSKSDFAVANIFYYVGLPALASKLIHFIGKCICFLAHCYWKLYILSPLFHNAHSIDVTSFIIILLGGAGRRNSTARLLKLQKASGFA